MGDFFYSMSNGTYELSIEEKILLLSLAQNWYMGLEGVLSSIHHNNNRPQLPNLSSIHTIINTENDNSDEVIMMR